MTQDETLAEVVKRTLMVLPQTRHLLLFGSRARGEARPDSDHDLLLLAPGLPTERARTTQLRLALRGLGAAFDIVALTPEEFAELQRSDAWYAREIRLSSRELLRVA